MANELSCTYKLCYNWEEYQYKQAENYKDWKLCDRCGTLDNFPTYSTQHMKLTQLLTVIRPIKLDMIHGNEFCQGYLNRRQHTHNVQIESQKLFCFEPESKSISTTWVFKLLCKHQSAAMPVNFQSRAGIEPAHRSHRKNHKFLPLHISIAIHTWYEIKRC